MSKTFTLAQADELLRLAAFAVETSFESQELFYNHEASNDQRQEARDAHQEAWQALCRWVYSRTDMNADVHAGGTS